MTDVYVGFTCASAWLISAKDTMVIVIKDLMFRITLLRFVGPISPSPCADICIGDAYVGWLSIKVGLTEQVYTLHVAVRQIAVTAIAQF